MPQTKPPQKNALDIRLAESVVFLRAGDATGRQRNIQADASPGMLRGLLTLTLTKPTRISSIEIELVGKTSTAWPEGVGARRVEVTEEHDIYSQSYVLFRAGSESPYRNSRRTLSVGPGLSLDHDEDDHSDQSSEEHHDSVRRPASTERRGREPGPPPATLNRGSRRHQSVDQTNFQRDYVSHRDNGRVASSSHNPPLSPPYSGEGVPPYMLGPLSPSSSISHRMHTVEESPIQESVSDLDEFGRRSDPDTERSSLASVHHVAPMSASHVGGSSSSSLRMDSPRSARPSLDEERPEFIVGSSSSPLPRQSRLRSSSRSAPHGREPSRSSDVREGEDGRGRKHKRFSFANVSNALLDVVMDRMRSRSRSAVMDLHGLGGEVTPPRGRTRERDMEDGDGSEEGAGRERSTLGRVGAVVGLDVDDGKEYGDGWKEFRKGVYTYPISFAIPASSPPTLHCEYGSVTWKLKAYAHRPGAFTSKLSASQEISVVACPSEDDLEETDSIIVERQWDTQMQYLITVSGRSFAIGGMMPISITFMPWTKMKVYRVSVLLEERVDYWTDFKRIARTDPITRIPLLALRNAPKDGPPILPLNPDDPQAFMRSPLSDVVPPDEDVGEYASSLMGPGPWRIRKDIQLPESCTQLHFTNRNKRSNIFVTHMLKIVFRVERGDDQAVDPNTGKRKMFDIVVQTPIHILSCLCNHDFLSLPAYSRSLEVTIPHHASCSYTLPNGNGVPHSSFLPGSHYTGSGAPPHSASTAEHLQYHHILNTPLSRQNSIFERGTQFERLIAGQESEIGEAPPAYEEVAHV